MTTLTIDPTPRERVILLAVLEGSKSRAQLVGRRREAGFVALTWPDLAPVVARLFQQGVLRRRRTLDATGGALAVVYYRLAPGWTRLRGGQWRGPQPNGRRAKHAAAV